MMLFKSVLGILCSSSMAAAYMEISWPYPLRGRFDPYSDPFLIDYSMTSPLYPDGMLCFNFKNYAFRIGTV